MEPKMSQATGLLAGQEVEVRQRFTADWASGFQIDEVDTSGPSPHVWLRRRSDGCRLPARFAAADVRQV
jgi:hypothetical protein